MFRYIETTCAPTRKLQDALIEMGAAIDHSELVDESTTFADRIT
jgi:hypothetical protein